VRRLSIAARLVLACGSSNTIVRGARTGPRSGLRRADHQPGDSGSRHLLRAFDVTLRLYDPTTVAARVSSDGGASENLPDAGSLALSSGAALAEFAEGFPLPHYVVFHRTTEPMNNWSFVLSRDTADHVRRRPWTLSIFEHKLIDVPAWLANAMT